MRLLRTVAYIMAVVFALMATGALDHPTAPLRTAFIFLILALASAGLGRITKGLK